MEKKVGTLVYEITSKIDGSFSSNLKKSEEDFKKTGVAIDKSQKAIDEFSNSMKKLTQDFRDGNITFSQFNSEIKKLNEAKNSSIAINSLSKEQLKLTDSLAKGSISVTEYQNRLQLLEKSTGGNFLSRNIDLLKLSITGFATAMGSQLIGNISRLGNETIKLASDTNESLSKVNVIFGKSSQAIQDFANKSAKSLGISKIDALDAASTFATFGKSAGLQGKELASFSLSLVKLSADIGSFRNASEKDVQFAIGAALRGEFESIGRYGVLINEARIKEKAFSLGLIASTKDSIGSYEKLQTVTELIKTQSIDSLNDFAETSSGLAGQQKILNATTKDLKASFGQSLLPATIAIKQEMISTISSTGELTGSMTGLANVTYGTVKILGGIAKSFLLVGDVIAAIIIVIERFAKSFSGVFDGISDGINSIAKGSLLIFQGKFKEAQETVKKGFNFTKTKEDFNFTQIILKEAGNKIAKTSRSINESFSEAFNGVSKEKIAQIADASAKVDAENKKLAQSSDTAGKEVKKLAKESDDLSKKLIDVKDNAGKAADELGSKLSEAYNKFSKDIQTNTEETDKKLSEIISKAETKKTELQKDIATKSTPELVKQLADTQRILDARVGYEARAQKRIDDIRAKAVTAGIDPNQIALPKAGTDFEKQIAEQKRLDALDEFSRFEEEQGLKLTKIAETAIQEILIIKAKFDKQKELETDLTKFISENNAIRQSQVDAFANNSIAKYGEMASALKNVLSLQSQVGSIKQGANGLPQFHDGGFVGASGGEVHTGELVLNANFVKQNADLVSRLNKMQSGQVNNISINSGNGQGVNSQQLIDNLTWRIRR
jgi:hypothetical protein